MCDCYEPKCDIEGCKKYIPVHIADSNYPREAIQVFCDNHLPDNNITIYKVTKRFETYKGDDYEKKGWKCGVRLCNGEVEPDSVGVFPNINNYYKTYILK